MNKSKLERFILKYNLGSSINSVKWICSKNKLYTRFMTPDKSLLGNICVDDFQFQDAKLGVYLTDQLQRLLSVVGDNIEMKLVEIDNKAVSLVITDTNVSTNFALADLSVIADPSSLTKLPTFETKIDIDSVFISTFIRGKGALPDANSFTVIKNGNVKIVIGHSLTNSNKVTIPVKSSEAFLIDYISFDANLFKEILLANRECSSAVLEIASKGLAHIVFKVDDFVAEYYLTALQDID